MLKRPKERMDNIGGGGYTQPKGSAYIKNQNIQVVWKRNLVKEQWKGTQKTGSMIMKLS